MAEAVLGKQAQHFLDSDVGRFLMGRAEQEEREALEALAKVSSWRRRRIQELQNQVWRAQSFKAWIVGLIQDGDAAWQVLQEIDANN